MLFLIPVVATLVGLGFPAWVFVASITILVSKRVEHAAVADSGSAP